MIVNPYVQFGGRCTDAFRYYEEHLGATDLMLMPYRGSPGEAMAPPEWRDKIMHGSLKLGNITLMGSDGRHGEPLAPMQRCALSLAVDTPAEAERIFEALARDGKVSMALGPSFFAQRFGMVMDQFGVAWMVICETAH
ncbi:MAG: VOC family protein [Massilia sp.]